MNYEQKYKNALERARDLMTNQNPPAFDKHLIEMVFPELKESEDERIRKAIIAYISHDQHCGVSNADMIAWLEKQDNKLDADRVIGWLVANICDFEYYVKLFKKDFGLC